MNTAARNRAGRIFAAECIGSFWLVLAGCGSAVLAGNFPGTGIGFLGIALAFGLALVAAGYALGAISGCHLNPAVTLGLCVAGRLPAASVPLYVAAQVAGACAAAALLAFIARGAPGFDLAAQGLGANGYGAHSPGGYGLAAAFVTEAVMSFLFLIVILGAGWRPAMAPLAPLASGLALAVIHLVSIPVTGTSVNPARSTGPALVMGGEVLGQLWLFWAAPIAGALVAALVWRAAFGRGTVFGRG